MTAGLAYTDRRGRIFFDAASHPLADGGDVRAPHRDELLPAPQGTVRNDVAKAAAAARRADAVARRRTALGALLPAGYTRLLVPGYVADEGAPTLPLFGYTFACVVDDQLMVAAAKTDEREDWAPRAFGPGELEELVAARIARNPSSRVLAQLAVCAQEYACFTAQNTFLAIGEAALPVSPRCNARCIGCISELDDDAGIPSPQRRIDYEAESADLAAVAIAHLERVPDGIVSFGQGCEGEPLLRGTTLARTIERVRDVRANGTLNCNTNGSLPKVLARLIAAGLDAVRISLNSVRPNVYAGYYRPAGYDLDDVLESVRLASRAGLRVSLNLLTHPGVTDDAEEVAALDAFLREVRVDLVQTRTLNIDPHVYFACAGRPQNPLGMRRALDGIRAAGARVGNFTHTH